MKMYLLLFLFTMVLVGCSKNTNDKAYGKWQCGDDIIFIAEEGQAKIDFKSGESIVDSMKILGTDRDFERTISWRSKKHRFSEFDKISSTQPKEILFSSKFDTLMCYKK